MEIINSLSGGKTSSFMAVHYPADADIFALVCVDDPACGHSDKKMMQWANDKINHFGFGEIIGTAESPVIFETMRDLEQMIGREITWVRGISFDALIRRKKAIPNPMKQFCSFELKMMPIFWYCYLNLELPVNMQIGYRADEPERAESLTTSIKANFETRMTNSGKWMNRWTEIEWRSGSFPLIENNIHHWQIREYWKGKNIPFPPDTNCQQCFWKPEQQLRKNMESSPAQMKWAASMEKKNRWKDKYTLTQIARMGIQMDFQWDGAGCKAGICTN